MREYANELEQYEADLIKYYESVAKYRSEHKEITAEFKRKLFEPYSDYYNEQLEIIYEKAHEMSQGDFNSVARYFDELAEFVKKFVSS